MSAANRYPGWIRHAGVGLQLAASIAGFALVGYWVDLHYGTKPWGILVGVMLGLVGGFYNLVKESLQAVQEAKEEDAEARTSAARPGQEPNGNGE